MGRTCRSPLRLRRHEPEMPPWQAALMLFCALVWVCPIAASLETVCHSSGKRPFAPFGLDLCYMHAHRTCCLSGYDSQFIRAAYQDILPGGAGCKGGSQRAYSSLYALRRYLCLPCDPNEPSYRFRSAEGDLAVGGVVPPSPSSSPAEFTWRICRSFLHGPRDSRRGLWGKDGSRYDQCGIVLQNCPATPVFNVESGQFTYPPATCRSGTELVLPSVAFKNVSDPGLQVLRRVAQTMPDFQIVVVNDSDPNFHYDKTPCFGRSSGSMRGELPRSPLVLVTTLLLIGQVLL